MKSTLIAIGTGACRILNRSIRKELGRKLTYIEVDRDTAPKELVDTRIEQVINQISPGSLIVIFVALGGATGDILSSAIVKRLNENLLSFHVIAVLPYSFEGSKNRVRAMIGLALLENYACSLSVYDNATSNEQCIKDGMGKDNIEMSRVLAAADQEIIGMLQEVIAGNRKPKQTQSMYKAQAMKQANVLYALGKAHEEGKEMTQDFKQAFTYYQRAAQLGHAEAMNDLAFLYQTGKGTEKDLHKALGYYRLAGEKGNAEACCILAEQYETGKEVNLDMEEAFRWYRKAAEMEMAYGMYKLSCLYRWGKGTSMDYTRSMYYLRRAAEKGYKVAREELRKEWKKQEAHRIGDVTRKEHLPFREKLQMIMAETGLPHRLFAKRIGVKEEVLQGMLQGQKEDLSFIHSLHRAFPEVDLNWLID